MDRGANLTTTKFAHSYVDPMLTANRVKLIHPSNAAIIAALAVTCWLPVALSAYFLA